LQACALDNRESRESRESTQPRWMTGTQSHTEGWGWLGTDLVHYSVPSCWPSAPPPGSASSHPHPGNIHLPCCFHQVQDIFLFFSLLCDRLITSVASLSPGLSGQAWVQPWRVLKSWGHLFFFLLLFCFLKTGSHYVAQADLELLILLPLPPKC
jgi:hypothetical protein